MPAATFEEQLTGKRCQVVAVEIMVAGLGEETEGDMGEAMGASGVAGQEEGGSREGEVAGEEEGALRGVAVAAGEDEEMEGAEVCGLLQACNGLSRGILQPEFSTCSLAPALHQPCKYQPCCLASILSLAKADGPSMSQGVVMCSHLQHHIVAADSQCGMNAAGPQPLGPVGVTFPQGSAAHPGKTQRVPAPEFFEDQLQRTLDGLPDDIRVTCQPHRHRIAAVLCLVHLNAEYLEFLRPAIRLDDSTAERAASQAHAS